MCNLKFHLGIPLVDTDIPSEIEYSYIHHSLKVTNRSSLAMSLTGSERKIRHVVLRLCGFASLVQQQTQYELAPRVGSGWVQLRCRSMFGLSGGGGEGGIEGGAERFSDLLKVHNGRGTCFFLIWSLREHMYREYVMGIIDCAIN